MALVGSAVCWSPERRGSELERGWWLGVGYLKFQRDWEVVVGKDKDGGLTLRVAEAR